MLSTAFLSTIIRWSPDRSYFISCHCTSNCERVRAGKRTVSLFLVQRAPSSVRAGATSDSEDRNVFAAQSLTRFVHVRSPFLPIFFVPRTRSRSIVLIYHRRVMGTWHRVKKAINFHLFLLCLGEMSSQYRLCYCEGLRLPTRRRKPGKRD